MLIYVIPLVILVIVLVIFNKRQKTQESDKTKTTPTKSKKSAASSKVTANKTQVVESSLVEKKPTTALTAETRNKIEMLIAERNFFSAEAQINQSLKRDNSQHELYLYLLDIHILQKDEFAISQLLSHIRSLELDDILEQAEAKKAEFENSQNVTDDAVTFVSLVTEESPVAAQSNSAFDALIDNTTPAPVEAKVEEIKPLDFNFTSTPKITEETPAPEANVVESKAVEFDSFSVQPKIEEDQTPVETPATSEIKPLDFSMDFAPAADKPTDVVVETEVAEKIEPLDFSFTTDIPAKEESAAETPALNFDLGSFDTAKTEEAAAPSVDFNLDTLNEKPAAPASTGVNFDISGISAQTTSATDQNDPLVQSFPELVNINEAALNIELAEQYIKLGLYEAARELLTEKEAEFSAEQRQQAEQLLNQIAS
ncbi:hypothetical protein B9T33_00255 [Acinetobacter sp. ANC 5054]|uniref:hypothetical protein n=1 Tax=Acinetobacter sp. ANC 5054 TaxID=1977877 RepID=UPI000A34B351|nr:hypothetical protein [Acinetobacter sp. ANC 5054]OTG84271.1 hypothetical protein B9T33_00255 [Acinetobacter sp. ANC 5054]